MLNTKKELQMIFDEFCHYNPSLVDAVVDWYPSGHLEIVVKLNSEEKLVYDYIMKTTRQVCKSYLDHSSVDYHTEQDFIDSFSWRLVKHVKASGLTNAEVAERIGVSPTQFSKYTTGKAIPNTYTLYKIASVLKCTPSELLWVK